MLTTTNSKPNGIGKSIVRLFQSAEIFKWTPSPSVLLTALLLITAPARTQTFTILHRCQPGTGMFPLGGLLQGPDGTLYGTASQTTIQPGLNSGPGTLFKMNSDGTGYTVLKEFSGSDGQEPRGDLVLNGDVLYGTTAAGGSNNAGTVFSVRTDGSNFTTLYQFPKLANWPVAGSYPMGGLVIMNGALWGTANYGGNPGDQGVLFKLNTNGSAFSVYSFFNGGNGRHPVALLSTGSWLYGTTREGGDSWTGTVFCRNTDPSSGSGFAQHIFSGEDDGKFPEAGLVLADGYLYGTTTTGGTNGYGTLYRVSTNLNDFVVLRHFSIAEGSPSGQLSLSGQILYGVTGNGGSARRGLVFKVNTDGSQFTVLREFAGGADDGDTPTSLNLSGSTLYGTTLYGGDPSGYEPYGSPPGAGMIFRLSLTSGLTLENPGLVGTNFCFWFQTKSNASYTVECQNNLGNTNWCSLQTMAGNGSLMPCLIPLTNGPRSFFRVHQP